MRAVSQTGVSLERAWLIAVALVVVTACMDAQADVPDADSHEVHHLLEYLRSSGCAVERNGESYNSEDAYSHVKKKYDYFRSKIQSTEEFIEYSATKSTMSSKYYLVYCEGQPEMRTRDWLLEELHRYREKDRDGKNAKVAGAYVFGHEVRSFQPCGSPKTYWATSANPEIAASMGKRHEELGAQPYGRIYVVVSGMPVDEKTSGFAQSYDGYFEISELLQAGRQIPPDCDMH